MQSLTSIIENCTECKLCVDECKFLSRLNKTPKEVARELAEGMDSEKGYVMTCFLCDLCRAVCPLSLNFSSVILYGRQKLSETLKGIDICYRLSLPDDQLFMIDAYKRYKNLSYPSLGDEKFSYAFFPGCAMSCFSPDATLQVYGKLKEKLNDVGFINLCCGKPLNDLGLTERTSIWLQKLEKLLKKHGSLEIITACPSCYYFMRSKLNGGFKLTTLYEVIGDMLKKELKSLNGFNLTVHDSCPDRFEGIFAKNVRKLFENSKIVEMKHNKERTLCCGQGGLVSCADSNLPIFVSDLRAEEFSETNAKFMVVYCYACAQTFWSLQPSIETKHVLDLALKTQDASKEVKSGELSNIIMKILTGEN